VSEGRIIKANLSLSPTRAKFFQLITSLFFFALKVRLKDLKFEFCQFKLSQINLQLTGKISLEFDFSSSSLL